MPPLALQFLPLSSNFDVSTFSCGHADLDEFLIEDSMEYQQERLSVTRLACIDTEVVGFFTLVTDCIDAKQVDPRDGIKGYPYRKYPAIKVARLATSSNYQNMGVGFLMLGEILALTIKLSNTLAAELSLWIQNANPRDSTRNSGSNEQPSDSLTRFTCIWITTNCWRKSTSQGKHIGGEQNIGLVTMYHPEAAPLLL